MAKLPFRMGHRFSKVQRQQLFDSHPEQYNQPIDIFNSHTSSSLPLTPLPMQSDPVSQFHPTANSVIIKICMLKVEHQPISMVSSNSNHATNESGCHHQHLSDGSAESVTSAATPQCCQCCPNTQPAVVVPLVQMSDITGEPNDDLQNANSITDMCCPDRIRSSEINANCTTCNHHIRNHNQIPENQHPFHNDHTSSVKRISTDDINRQHNETSSPLTDNHRNQNVNRRFPAGNSNARMHSLPFCSIGISCCESTRKTTDTSSALLDKNHRDALTSFDGQSGSRLESSLNESESIGRLQQHQHHRPAGATTATPAVISCCVQAIQRLEITEEDGKNYS